MLRSQRLQQINCVFLASASFFLGVVCDLWIWFNKSKAGSFTPLLPMKKLFNFKNSHKIANIQHGEKISKNQIAVNYSLLHVLFSNSIKHLSNFHPNFICFFATNGNCCSFPIIKYTNSKCIFFLYNRFLTCWKLLLWFQSTVNTITAPQWNAVPRRLKLAVSFKASEADINLERLTIKWV